MVSDRVFLDSSVLAFIISFEAKIGNVVGGASLVEELGDVIRTASRSDADTLRALLQLRKAASDRAANTETMLGPMRLDGVPSTRALIRSVIRVGEGDAYAKRANLASCRSRGTLNDALHAAMADRDYPAAVVVLNLFERWRQTPSHTTYSIVLNALVTQGHHLAFFANPGELTESNSKFNLESTLHSMARDGNGEQADLIRRAVGNKLDDNEGFFVSANPDYTLRQTQYMIRVLNRVCAAEIEFDGPIMPNLHGCVTILRRVILTSQRILYRGSRVEEGTKCHLCSSGLLAWPKETRRQLKPSQKAPLFTSSPALSPRRRTYLSKPNSNKYAILHDPFQHPHAPTTDLLVQVATLPPPPLAITPTLTLSAPSICLGCTVRNWPCTSRTPGQRTCRCTSCTSHPFRFQLLLSLDTFRSHLNNPFCLRRSPSTPSNPRHIATPPTPTRIHRRSTIRYRKLSPLQSPSLSRCRVSPDQTRRSNHIPRSRTTRRIPHLESGQYEPRLTMLRRPHPRFAHLPLGPERNPHRLATRKPYRRMGRRIPQTRIYRHSSPSQDHEPRLCTQRRKTRHARLPSYHSLRNRWEEHDLYPRQTGPARSFCEV